MDKTSQAVLGPVEPPVGHGGKANSFAQRAAFAEVCAMLPDGCDWGDTLTPAIARRIVDATRAAEREHFAKAFDAMREKTLAAQSGPDNEIANVMLRQLAELGFGECARALRA